VSLYGKYTRTDFWEFVPVHKQALHLYNTDTESWKELSSKAEREREERVAAAAAESRDLVNNMNIAMRDANSKMA